MKIFSPNRDKNSKRDWLRRISLFIVSYLAVAALVGVYWSSTPTTFDIAEKVADYAAAKDCSIVTGSKMTASLVENYSKDLSIEQIKQISLELKAIVVTQFDGLIDRVAN